MIRIQTSDFIQDIGGCFAKSYLYNIEKEKAIFMINKPEQTISMT